MAVKVVEIELERPIPCFKDLDLKRYSWLQILVRKNRYPIGYAWIHIRSKRFLQSEFIRFEIERQLFDELNRAELNRTLKGELATPDPTESTQAFVTVAVCTRNRPESLERCLASVTRLEYAADRLEIVVIDNAPSDDATKKVVAKFPHIRYVIEPRPGLDWARNRAIDEAKGEIIAYTDDDVEVDSLWVQTLVSHFSNPAVMCVTGLVVPAERETEAQNLFEEYHGFGKGFELRYYTLGIREHWRSYPAGAGIFGTGANMAFRKSLFKQIGSFDEALDVGTPSHGAGDLEMFYRTVRAGYILVYEPQAIIKHYHRRDFAKLRDQIRDWGRGTYAFWTKLFLTDREMRWHILEFALSWYLRHLLKRVVLEKSARRKLAMAEAVGALQGPFAYYLAHRQAAKIARQYRALDRLGLLSNFKRKRGLKPVTLDQYLQNQLPVKKFVEK